MAKKGSPIQPLSVFLRTDPKYNLEELQGAINDWEDHFSIRLANLKGDQEDGVPFNVHTYESVNKKDQPLSKLFPISGGGPAKDDPVVKTWLEQHKDQKIRSEENVYISNSLTKIAVVN